MTRYNVEIIFEEYGWDVDSEHRPAYCYFGTTSLIYNCRLPYERNALSATKKFIDEHICFGNIHDGGVELKLKSLNVIPIEDK